MINSEFNKFIKRAGGDKNAASILGCSQGMISHMRVGRREINKAYAKTIWLKFPRINRLKLLYPETTDIKPLGEKA